MRSFDEIRVDVLALLERVAELVGGPEAARRIALAVTRLADGPLWTAVCGEYKRGKSTLLSALLEEPGLFPADSLPATNAVTTVRWGTQEKVTVSVRLPDGTVEQAAITRDQIADYVTEGGNPGNEREVLAVEIEIPNPKLRSGLAFADLPGVGGVIAQHQAVTLSFLPTADALLFVTDVEAPLLASELGFLRRAIDAASLTGDTRSIVCVLTKIDEGPEYEELLTQDRAELAGMFGIDADHVVFIPVSSWEKLDYLAGGDEQALAGSNFAALEAALWTALGSRRARVLLGGAVREAREQLLGALAPIEAAWQARQDKTGARLVGLQSQMAAQLDELARLEASKPTWIKSLDRELSVAQTRLEELAVQELDKDWQRFLTVYLNDDGLLADPDRIRVNVDSDTAALLGVLRTLARREAAKAMERFSDAHGLSVSSAIVTDLPDLPPPVLAGDLSAITRSKGGSGWVKARGASVGVSLGSLVGGLIGAVVGTIVTPGPGTVAGAIAGAQWGAPIVAAIGGGFGYKSASDAVQARDAEGRRRELTQLFSTHRSAQERYLKKIVKMTIDEARPVAVAELESRLRQRKETIEAVQRRLTAEQQGVRAGQATDEARYLAERKPLDEELDVAGQLDAEIDELAGGGA
jgi:hypothetical protein